MAKSTLSVVVVDDGDDIRALLARGIERHAELAVVGEAADFAAATEVIAALQPDVALIDRSMPIPPTPAGLRALREQAPSTVLILLSAYPVETLEAELREAADASLEKAMRLPQLLEAILEVVRSAR